MQVWPTPEHLLDAKHITVDELVLDLQALMSFLHSVAFGHHAEHHYQKDPAASQEAQEIEQVTLDFLPSEFVGILNNHLDFLFSYLF